MFLVILNFVKDNLKESILKLISIIIPVYKVEEYLRQCVDSILAQTHKNLQVVLVDGCSVNCCDFGVPVG